MSTHRHHWWFAPMFFTALIAFSGCVSWWGGGGGEVFDTDPVISNGTVSDTTPTAGETVNLSVTATDPQGQTLTYAWDDGSATAGEFTGAGASVSWSSDAAGNYTITCTVTDTDGNSTTQTFNVTVDDGGGGGDPQGYLDADGFNGGQLYDEFWQTETGWDQGDANLATFGDSKDFFKCKQCHGWDLLGNKGAYISRAPKTTRPNVTGLNLHTIAAGMTEQELFDAMKSSTGRRGVSADLSTYDPDTNAGTGDQMPDYGSFMSDGAIWDLVKFMKETALDTSTLYDSATTGTYPTGSMAFSNVGKAGNAANGNTVYAANCVGCHGADGTLILVDHDTYTMGSFIRQKANEAQHKIRYGQLGSPMGGLVTDAGDMLDVYKALADPVNFPDPAPPGDPQGYLDADGLNGGQLYDEFWATETGWDQGDPNLATFGASKDFFKCKQCHGWDLLGNMGAYISRAPKTTRPNVTGLNLHTIAAGMTPQELFDALKSPTGRRGIAADLSTYDPDTNAATGDQMPDYGSFMTDGQIWDLVKFLKDTAIDTSTLYDSTATGTYPTGSMEFTNVGKAGNAANGNTVYTTNCAGCHGADGTLILVDHDTYTIGSFIRGKANEAQHKIKYGQLGSAMGGLVTDDGDMLDVYKALADPVAFPDPGPPSDLTALSVPDASVYYANDAAGWSSVSGISRTVSSNSFGIQTTGNPATGGHGPVGSSLPLVTMKAVHDGTNFAMRFEWDDDDANETHNFWTYSTGAWTRGGNEDRMYVMWETGDPAATGRMGQTFGQVGCAMSCHQRDGGGNSPVLDTTTELFDCSGCHTDAPGATNATFAHIATTMSCDSCHTDYSLNVDSSDMISPSLTATYDMWHWKAGRSNPLGIVEDQYMPPALRRTRDQSNLAPSGNEYDSASAGGAIPLYAFTDDRADGSTSYLMQSQVAAMVAADELATWDEAGASGPNYYLSDGTTTFTPGEGATIPRAIHNDVDVDTDRSGNTKADAVWSAGKWVVVVNRVMVSGEVDDNSDPTDIDFVTGSTYPFGFAVTDNSGTNHMGLNLLRIDFE